jgi:hypothetical protein
MHKVFCDKCGKEFWAWQQEYRYELRKSEKGTFPQRIDLCDNCRKTFEKWMDEFIENKEVGE